MKVGFLKHWGLLVHSGIKFASLQCHSSNTACNLDMLDFQHFATRFANIKLAQMPGFVMLSFIMPALSAFSTASEPTRSPCCLLTCAKVTLPSLLMMKVDG